MHCKTHDTTTPCGRCNLRHPGHPFPRICRTIDELKLDAEQGQGQLLRSLSANQRTPEPPDDGPGTQLHALLGRFGLTASGDCKCTSRVAYMDKMEAEQPGWCAANIEEIVGWLRESAAERGLPFLDAAGRLLIRRAIANARRKEAARVATEAADRPSLRPEQ